MSLILIVSVMIRLVAMSISIVLLRIIPDWRMGFLTVMLGLMALCQTFTLLTEKASWSISVTVHATELPGLIVSIMTFLLFDILAGPPREQTMWDRKKERKI